ncbi:MAG: T9SS type A sorting domain-containing protein [Bacteroidales bacterium]|nr:T9SS type A sorting domain-containing protein [Bacteroidales bacterium]
MKNNFTQRILTLFCGAMFSASLMAASPAEVWTKPAAFTANDSVEWYFDVTGTALEGETSTLYLWTWVPSEPDAGNWGNSSDFAALTQVEGNIWKIKLKPVAYYNVSAETITTFAGLLKTKDGSKQTDGFDINMYDFSAIKGDSLIAWTPTTIKNNRPFSVLVNASKTWSKCDVSAIQGDILNAESISMHSGINGWQNVVGADNVKATMDSVDTNIFRIDIIPSEYYGVSDTTVIAGVNVVFSGDVWQTEGKDVGCTDFYIENDIDEEPEEPEEPEFVRGIQNTLDVKVYPNLLTGNQHISVVCSDKITYLILDATGRARLEGVLSEGVSQIAVSGLSDGMYILQLANAKGEIFSTKIIKY